ncbi:MAG TPA: F0F1 ATP synthase subunit B [Nevskiaceae bacterium]|nr:F0F1 ATP synthase subunit B [Nevskiaceae bacterium]
MQFFATTEHAASPGLIEALGLNLQLFIEQGIAFLILVFVLGKFVYPALIKAIDDRRTAIEAGLQEAKQSQEALEKAEAKVADMLDAARKEADDVIARSQQEAAALVAEAESKAKTRADQIVKDARAQLDVDVSKARDMLKTETVKLVALATEHVVHEKLDDKRDAGLIREALKEQA